MKTLACPECQSDIFYLDETESSHSGRTDTYCCANGHVCTLQYKMVKTTAPDASHKAAVVALDAREISLLGDAPLH